MNTTARNNAALAMMLLGMLLLVFGALFSAAIATLETSRATRAEQLDPATPAQIAQRAPGREVLVEGRVDGRARKLHGDLVAYVVERRETTSDSQERWQEIERVAPPLLLALPDGTAQLVAGYELDTPPSTLAEGDTRYRGFVAGSVVTAIGSIVEGSEGHAIRAEVLFGGDRAAYIAAHRAGAGGFGYAGAGFAFVGLLLLLLGWRNRQPRARKASAFR